MRKLIIIVWILFCSNLLAQQKNEIHYQNQDGERPTGTGSMSGIIIDKQTNEAVEYANIVIFKLQDKKMLSGAISNAQGKFFIDKIPFGLYKVTIDFIGYDKLTIDSVYVRPQNPKVNLGKRLLSQSIVLLDGVDIVANKIVYEYKIDKKVVNVGQDITAAGGTAADVLENTPSVDVDIEGNVTLRGSSNFTVLINGRPSILEGSDALQQLPASSIENIEIITNPSAKFDPEGTAGIINVIMKKEIDQGLNGIVNLSIGINDKYRSDILLNYKTSKWNFIGGFDFRDDNFKMERTSEREVYLDNITEYFNNSGNRNMKRKSIGGRFGIEFSPTNKTVIGISGRSGIFEFGITSLSRNNEYTIPSSTNLFYINEGNMNRSSNYFNLNFNLQHEFEQKGHKLELLFYHAKRDGDSDDENLETETDAQWNKTINILNSNRSIEISDNENFRIQFDYVKPISDKGKMELGYQARLSESDEDYTFEEFIDNNWVKNDLYSSTSNFKRNIHSTYAMLNNETENNFGYQFGLRTEYTFRETGVKGITDIYKIDRFDFFPSIHFSKQLGKENQIVVSYTRRINRPGGRELDPFLSYMDENNRMQGNPGLEPEYINSYELGWQKRWLSGFMSLEAYYRIRNNKITRIFINKGEYVLHTSTNLDKDYSLGTEIMINYDFSKKLNTNLSGTIYYYKIKGNIESQTSNRESTNWNTSLNTNYKFTMNTRWQFRLGYRGPSVTAQGKTKGFLTSETAFRYDFWNRKANLILQVSDLFKTMKREITIESNNIWEHMNMKRESQIVRLTFSYKLNNYKQKRENENNDEMNTDMEIEY